MILENSVKTNAACTQDKKKALKNKEFLNAFNNYTLQIFNPT